MTLHGNGPRRTQQIAPRRFCGFSQLFGGYCCRGRLPRRSANSSVCLASAGGGFTPPSYLGVESEFVTPTKRAIRFPVSFYAARFSTAAEANDALLGSALFLLTPQHPAVATPRSIRCRRQRVAPVQCRRYSGARRTGRRQNSGGNAFGSCTLWAWFIKAAGLESLLPRPVPQINLKIRQRPSRRHQHQTRQIHLRVLQQIVFAPQIEIHQPYHRAVRRHYR